MLRIRPTRLGVKALLFYGLLLLAFFVAPYLNLFFLLLSFATVTAVLGLLWGLRNLAGTTGEMEGCAPVVAAAAEPGRVRIDSGRRARHGLDLSLRIGGQEHQIASQLGVPAGAETQAEVMLPALARGAHPIEALQLSSVHPFGLFRISRRLPTPQALLVYPAPADLAAWRDRNNGAGLGNVGGDQEQELGCAGLRDFRDGDELRGVHWKATARRGELVIREFEGDSSPGLEVLLDLRCAGETMEEALSLCCALALECQTNKELFTLRSQDHQRSYGKGHANISELLRYLAMVQSLGPGGAAPPPVSPRVLRLPTTGHPAPRPRQGVLG